MIQQLDWVARFNVNNDAYPTRARVTLDDRYAYVVRCVPTQEKAVLRHLMDSGSWVSCDELSEVLWGLDDDGGPDWSGETIRVLIYRLRERLRDGFLIESRYGRGYRFVVTEEAFVELLGRSVSEALAA